jgi:soluble lytic murein transglycosylase-like protein
VGALTRFLPAVLLLAATPANADDVARWRPMVEEASSRFGIPTSWIERVIWAESRGYTALNGRPIRSRAGAMGLMQLMPATWADMRARLGLGGNPDDPRDNILAGTFFLRLMYDRFGYPGLFGAYNAGPGAYVAWLAGNRRLPGETVAYLGTVGGTSQPTSLASQAQVSHALFVVRRIVPGDQSSSTAREPQASLFAVRNVGP